MTDTLVAWFAAPYVILAFPPKRAVFPYYSLAAAILGYRLLRVSMQLRDAVNLPMLLSDCVWNYTPVKMHGLQITLA